MLGKSEVTILEESQLEEEVEVRVGKLKNGRLQVRMISQEK